MRKNNIKKLKSNLSNHFYIKKSFKKNKLKKFDPIVKKYTTYSKMNKL